MRRVPITVLSLALMAGLANGQKMNGTYTINPAGSGSRNFKTFKDAAKAVFFFGIDGPVTFRIVTGTYKESFFLLPVEGASATNRITFRPLVPIGSPVKLQGTATETITMFQGVPSLKMGFYTFDGLIFERGGMALTAGQLTEDVEIKNCTFERAHSPGFRGMIYVEGGNTAQRWRIHHNIFRSPPNGRILYGSQIGRFKIHSNVFDFGTGGGTGIYLINNNNSLNEIYNNLFYGKLGSSSGDAAIQVNLSNINNTIAHNTFFIDTAAGQAIATFGTTSNFNKIFGNVIYVKGGGTCLSVAISSGTLQNWSSDGNLFWAPGGNVGQIGSGTGATKYATLKAWQGVAPKTGQLRDPNSIEADPMFFDISKSPPDLHVKAGSPVRDKARRTPAYVLYDVEGRVRDQSPDIGAYELNGFAVWGNGCAGTGARTPVLAATGTVGLGQRFSITCANGKPSAAAMLVFGTSHESWGAFELPLTLPGGCTLYVSIDVPSARLLDNQGAGNVPLLIPNDSKLGGLNFLYQWLILDSASSSPFGLSHSNAGSANL